MRGGFKRKKGQKYNNVSTVVDEIKFDSKKESERYLFLKEALDRGKISNLQRQVKYELIPPVIEEYVKHLKTKDKTITRTIQRPINYTCDFQYDKDGETIVEDVKASPYMLPKEFVIKEKLFFWKFGKRIRKVYDPKEDI